MNYWTQECVTPFLKRVVCFEEACLVKEVREQTLIRPQAETFSSREKEYKTIKTGSVLFTNNKSFIDSHFIILRVKN
jgi:hypothetical protein